MTTVLHVISGLGSGGAEANLVNLSCALQKRGMPQHVVSVGGEDTYGGDLKRFGVPLSSLHLSSPYQLPSRLWTLSRLIRQVRPDVIQGWMYHGNLIATLADRLTPGRASRRLLWNLRASNMDSDRYARVVHWGAMLSRWPDVIVSNSEAGETFHREQGYRARVSRVIANGIDTEKFRPDATAREAVRSELGIPLDRVVVVHAARVDAMKDHRTCLAALAAAPEITAVLAGTGTTELQLPPNARALGMRRDVDRIYAAADIVISSSAFGEGFSNAIAEGMSCGLVPVTTNVGDARQIVGDTGLVIPTRDPQALTVAIAEIAALPAAERVARGLRARARIVEQFSLAKAVDAYAALYGSRTTAG